MKQNNLKVIGLTGGIASGKSTVSKYLKEKGYHVIDADDIARDVVKKGSKGLKAIKETFGASILNETGDLNRGKMRRLVFDDSKAMKKLEAITHPLIIKRIEDNIKTFKSNNKEGIVFLDCPILFEMGLEYLVDEIWLVASTIKNQIRRIINRDATSAKEAKKIIDKQLPLAIKAEKSDVVIENNESILSLKLKIDLLLKERC